MSDIFYNELKDDINNFVFKLWELGLEKEKSKIWNYINTYWDCMPLCNIRDQDDNNIITNIVDYISYNIKVNLSGDYMLINGKEIKDLSDLYDIL